MQTLGRYLSQNQFLATLVFVGFLFFLVEIKEIIISLFIAYIIMASLAPFAQVLSKNRFPKAIAVAIPFFSFIALFVLLIFPLFPFFISQVQSFFAKLPSLFHQTAQFLRIQIDIDQIRSFITSDLEVIGKNAFTVTSKFFGGLFSLLTILVVSFYLLIDHDRIKESITRLFPARYQKRALDIFAQAEKKLGAWVRGQLILSIVIGVFTWITLTIIGLDFALPLAILAGILEIVPTIGPIIASIPAILVALTVSPTMAIIVIIAYVIIQALENNLLVPKIMGEAVGLHSIVIIISIMIGAKLLGAIGALLSIPFISLVFIICRNLKEE